MVREPLFVTLEEVVGRLEEFSAEDVIYAEAPTGSARAAVGPDEANLGVPYLLEVALAREAIEVWQKWRGGRVPTLEDKVAAVAYYARNDAFLPVE
jgi:hypothetical protein